MIDVIALHSKKRHGCLAHPETLNVLEKVGQLKNADQLQWNWTLFLSPQYAIERKENEFEAKWSD
jgi:hypothetical protein